MDLRKKKLKASTLAEVLVAMIIVMLSFGIALTIFVNVTGSSAIEQRTRADLIIRSLAASIIDSGNYIDAEVVVSGIKVKREILPWDRTLGLSVLKLTAFDRHGKKISEQTQIIIPE